MSQSLTLMWHMIFQHNEKFYFCAQTGLKIMIETKNKYIIKTYQNNEIKIQFKKLDAATNEILAYLSPEEFNSYCKTGCPNYNQKWTCPPNCPPFIDYAKNYPKLNLYLFYTSPNQFDFISQKDRSLTAYNFIKEELQSYLSEIEPVNGKMIAANSCEICKICALIKGNQCHIPEKVRYNLVAFGFNVSKIMSDLFQHKIKWAKQNEPSEYVSSVGAILKEE